ncbi:hypothetical protein [Candidatus Neptunichlamydia sp. REUL1]|uniref:hypothetical protein n=1 Tax=Candidatus Neptunichlamydia sp. REUL1 TaxID=3064277 RepID=UPI00292D2AB1|nr:hypothetical protein [Candidatus Neptunochlamydia sp. REUL1]
MGKMPLPRKLSDREKEEIHKERPLFMAKKSIEFTENPELYNQPNKKITDFTPLIYCIWKIFNKSYQEQYWGKQGQWGDNFGETMETFRMDCEAVLDTDDIIEMTQKQREMITELLRIVEDYSGDKNTPLSRYGENDQAIINDPRWQEIGKYAKLVYEELSGDDLDAWERSRNGNNYRF